jgi:hypothetical protein
VGAPLGRDGEQFTWQVSFRGLSGGRARLALGTRREAGEDLIVAHLQAEAAGVVGSVLLHVDELVNTFAASDGLPRTSDGLTVTRDKEVHVRTHWDLARPSATIAVESSKAPARRAIRSFPADAPTYDVLGAFLMMRGWSEPAGARATFYTLAGQRLWHTVMTMRPPERIGAVMARRIDGVSERLTWTGKAEPKHPSRHFSVWFAADDSGLPLRIVGHTELGEVTAELTSHAP